MLVNLRNHKKKIDAIGMKSILEALKYNTKFHYDEIRKTISKKKKY